MNSTIRITLIISTYNSTGPLEVVLNSVLKQYVLPDEVVIADDGSGPETKNLIDRFTTKFPVSLVHIWHPDNGYQLSTIKNKAVAAAKGDYIIFIDGDLVLHPYFIFDYKQNLHTGEILVASRVFLSEAYTKKLLLQKEAPVKAWPWHSEKNWPSAIRITWLHHFIKGSTSYAGARGGLMGVFRNDYIKVNGFDESFTGWGREDSDLFVRLLNSGIKRKNIKFAAITYHLWHPVLSRQQLATNDSLLEKTIAEKSVWCKMGIHQYL